MGIDLRDLELIDLEDIGMALCLEITYSKSWWHMEHSVFGEILRRYRIANTEYKESLNG